MRDKNYYASLFESLTSSITLDMNDFKEHLKDYLHFLDDKKNYDILLKINQTSKLFFSNKKYLFENFENFELDDFHKISIISFLIFKSISKSSKNDSIYAVNYSNSDYVLNEITGLYTNLNIFYCSKEPKNTEIHSLKGDAFKTIKYLILDGVVVCKNNFYKNRTLEEWSFGNENIKYSYVEVLKILNKEPKVINIDNNYYCIGNFFIFIKKIFIENVKSNYFFKINDFNYINNIAKIDMKINMDDLNDVIKIQDKKYTNKDEINLNVKKKNEEIYKNLIRIKFNKKEIKKLILIWAKNSMENTLDLEKNNLEIFFIKIFYNFCERFINKNHIDLILKKDYFLNIVYYEFTNKFSSAFAKAEFENIDDLLELSKDFKDFNIDFSEEIKIIKKDKIIFDSITTTDKKLKKKHKGDEIIIKKKELLNDDKKNKLIKKINPLDIPLIKYLVIFSKKEIEEIIRKIIKNINNYSIDNLNFLSKNNDKDDLKLGCFLIIKFGDKKNLDIYNVIKEIDDLSNRNKDLFAELSKISHIENLYMLRDYLNKNELVWKKDKFNNISVNFMFFFDFRGRFYYDSPISPTNNRFCRFIFNYGVEHKNNMMITNDRISLIIKNNMGYVMEIKKIFKIYEDSDFINESVFWISISIGKIKINKSKVETKIEEFFEMCIKLVTKEIELDDDLDIVELRYYIKIINNLKDDLIVKRCLVKDATASFFQNLIRILGHKNEYAKKVANLDSEDTWYDWYTYLLTEWRKSKEISNYDYLFTRKTIKKVAMTFPYSATYNTCYEYFENSIYENFKLNISKNPEIINEFKNFYNFIKEIMKNKGPFKESTDSINNHFKKIIEKSEPIIIIAENEDLINLTYYKTKTKHFDFIIKWRNSTKRIIKNYIVLNKELIDKRKTNSALKANLVHFADALLVRDINCNIGLYKKTYFISVHDSFLVDFSFTSEFISIANKSFNKNVFKNEIWKNEKNYFSIFIFL